MHKSKTISMALTMLGLGAAASFAEVKLGENLSVSGFLDMSSSGVSPDVGDATLNAEFDQLELDFMLKFGNISARADINSLGPVGGVSFEQGFVTAGVTDAFSVSVGKFLSSSGFEAAEPTGMYQFSYSKQLVYGGYQNGLNLAYSTPKFGLYGAVVTSVWDGSDTDLLTPGFEAQVSVMPVDGITAKVAYLTEPEVAVFDDVTGLKSDSSGQSLVNAWVQYAKGQITVAGEYDQLIDWGAADASGMGWLVMANVKATDKIAATVRYSGIKFEDVDADTEFTFSPSYAISPNWLALAELKYEIDAKATDYAVESTFSF